MRHYWRNGEAPRYVRPLATPLTTPEDTEQLIAIIAMAFADYGSLFPAG